MKKLSTIAIGSLFTMAICLCFTAIPALATDEASGGWRGTWDEVMLWLNFAILAFVIIKFGRKPIMDFLQGQKKVVADEIRQIEDEKEKVTAKIKETLKELEESEIRFAEVKQRIIEQGEKRKAEIIENARRESQIMLETAKQKIDSHLIHAKSKFRSDLIDDAVALAMERLPKEITQEDSQRFVNQYFSDAV